jgi:hypothetical protein
MAVVIMDNNELYHIHAFYLCRMWRPLSLSSHYARPELLHLLNVQQNTILFLSVLFSLRDKCFFLLTCEMPMESVHIYFRFVPVPGNYGNCPRGRCDHNVGEAVQVPLLLLQFYLTLPLKTCSVVSLPALCE